MLSGLSELGQAYLSILNVYSLAYGLGGALLGIMVGCLPGLSATLCIALLTPLSIKMAPNDAILILICSYVGTLDGGWRRATMIKIPGTVANAASCADGHALALRGEAGRAMGIATSGAFSGTLFGVLCLAAFTPLLDAVSLSFGAYEFFWLALPGVAMSGSIVGNDPLKGWLMGTLGLFVAQIGQEGLYAHDRFTFGWSQLSGGISLIPALVGAFGFAEVLTTLADPVERKMVEMRDSVLPRFREVAQYWRTVLRSGVIGVLTGLMPGGGEDAGAWMSYAAAKAVSKELARFASASRLFDIYCMMAIGIGAFFLRRRGYQMAPFVLGLVLGGLLDKSLRRGLVLSDGSLEPFFTRPISVGFATVTILILLLYIPAFKSLVTTITGTVSRQFQRFTSRAA